MNLLQSHSGLNLNGGGYGNRWKFRFLQSEYAFWNDISQVKKLKLRLRDIAYFRGEKNDTPALNWLEAKKRKCALKRTTSTTRRDSSDSVLEYVD